MKKLMYLAPIALTMLAGCNQTTRVFDSEISAIDRQTEVLKEQNKILERIAAALEKQEGGGGLRIENGE